MELLLLETGQLFRINKEVITIGRSPDCDYFLEGRAISRTHLTLACSDFGCIANDGDLVKERFSANGVKINGKMLKAGSSQLLKHGDEIQLAPGYTLKFFDIPKKKEIDSEPTLF